MPEVLRATTSTGDELPKEEVWSHKSVTSKEEIEVEVCGCGCGEDLEACAAMTGIGELR